MATLLTEAAAMAPVTAPAPVRKLRLFFISINVRGRLVGSARSWF